MKTETLNTNKQESNFATYRQEYTGQQSFGNLKGNS